MRVSCCRPKQPEATISRDLEGAAPDLDGLCPEACICRSLLMLCYERHHLLRENVCKRGAQSYSHKTFRICLLTVSGGSMQTLLSLATAV
mmetsp:Transcript_12811/g.41738  ORF Transcript_12811/g.41738 Transcript_12811/m.41738 type:complete len:90 (+) Transcript_12811:60-329(+)